jgi:CDP-diacylglycerol--serine O-phosphatidyltransferase
MKWRRIIPTLLTLSILALGFGSILKSAAGEFALAAQLIVLAAILDGLDGEVARLFRGVTAFGAKLDTYVDMVCFGVAPAVLVHQSMWKDVQLWSVVVPTAIVASGALRFARYSTSESRVKHHTFRGLPIPVSAIWLAMFVLFTESDLLIDTPFAFPHGPLVLVMWSCAIAFLLLQVSNVRYAKPTKEMIGLGLAATLVLMLATGRLVAAFCVGTCFALFFFAFFGPFLVRGMVEEDSDEEEPVTVRRL